MSNERSHSIPPSPAEAAADPICPRPVSPRSPDNARVASTWDRDLYEKIQKR